MTGYDRIKNVLLDGVSDRTPTMLHNFMAAAEEKKYTMGEFRKSPEKIARTFIDYSRKYDLDGILVDIDTCVESHAIGVPTDFPEDAPARNHGAIKGGIDACIEAMDPKKIRKDERANIVAEAVHLIKKEVDGELFLRGNADQGPFSLAMLSYGMSEFMMALMDEEMKPKIKTLMDRALEVHLEYHKMLFEAGADMTSFGDSSCGPDLISADMYREFALPYHKKIAKILNDMNILNLCHVCGNTDLIIEDLASAGFSAVEIDYKTDIVKAQKILKDKAVLFGPIDPSGIFYFGSPEDLKRETKKVMDIFEGKGIVIGAGCALPTGVPEANVRAFMDTVKNYS
ncbi:uroporphyrinogen decarboxylase family protein [Clostridium sediminicola]|uniref:uroporphyrinogen decarboxylase family protein n=1 Tax=Clostridium sediminicola TaxID=3114879 RepID=UPI0031F27B87